MKGNQKGNTGLYEKKWEIVFIARYMQKFRTGAVCFVMSVGPFVCPSVRMEKNLLPLDGFP